jgi:hypothetical protein
VLDSETLEVEKKQLDLEDSKLDLALERNRVRERLRKAINSDRMGEIRSGQEMRRFLHETEKAEILRKEEMDEYVLAFEENREDHETARAHMVRKLAETRQAEIDRMKVDHVQELEKRDILHEIEKEELVVKAELGRDRLAAAQKIELEIEEHRKDMQVLRDMLDLKKLDKEQEIEAKAKLQSLDLELQEKQSELAIRRAQADSDMRISEMKASADVKAAEIGAYKGLTEDQILAIQSAKSPAVAEALKAKFQAQIHADARQSEKIEGLYKEWMDRADRDKQAFMEFAKEAMHTQKETAVGTSRPIITGAGQPVPGQPADPSRKVIRCAKCRYEISAASNPRHCPNCGGDL